MIHLDPSARCRFFLIGPGRSGTTMFQDEINAHPEIRCYLEPFHRVAAQPRLNPLFAGEPLFDEFQPGADLSDEAEAYRNFISHLEEQHDRRVWGFKLISTNVKERPGLLAVLRQAGFRALLVQRRNEVQTALSLLIAAQRGVFNSRQQAPGGQVSIDGKDLLRTILAARGAGLALPATLLDYGFPVQKLVYEDRLAGGLAYNRRAYDFLGVDPAAAVEASTLTRMAPAGQYAAIIANFDEVRDILRLAHLDHLLV